MWLDLSASDSTVDPFLNAWTRLATSTNQADPFCCAPIWQLAFHEVFSPNRRLFLAASSESQIAFAEASFSPEELFLTPIETSWLFACPLLGKEAVALLAEALDSLAAFYAPLFPHIIISGVRPGSSTSRRLLQRFGKGFDLFLHSHGVQCAASLEGGLDGFLGRRSANRRSKLLKAVRQAAQKGISFERIIPASPEEAGCAYRRMLAVEASSWKGIGHCGMAESPSREFYGVMLRRLSGTQEARIMFARHEDRDIGFIFGGMAGTIYRGQQFSYDHKWKDWSVGNIMQLEQIAWLCEEGAARYDMGPLDGPRMEYKRHWTEERLEIQTWILAKR